MGEIINFPVSKVMSSEVAEVRIGDIIEFKTPSTVIDKKQWVDCFLIGRNVLIGWGSVNQGIIKVFKKGLFVHRIIDTVINSNCVGVMVDCHLDIYNIYNMEGYKPNGLPALLLSIDQERLFTECQKCKKKF